MYTLPIKKRCNYCGRPVNLGIEMCIECSEYFKGTQWARYRPLRDKYGNPKKLNPFGKEPRKRPTPNDKTYDRLKFNTF